MPPGPAMQMPAGAEPSTFDKVKMGATMGTVVGLSMGFIFGSFTVLSGGAGPKGPLHTLSKYMLSSAGTFGFFMGVGSVVRGDGQTTSITQAFREDRLLRFRIASEREGADWRRQQQQQQQQRRS